MALRRQIVPLVFREGLDTKVDSKASIGPAIFELENAVFTKAGALQKRFGYDSLSKQVTGGASSISTGADIKDFNQELVLFSGTRLYSLSNELNEWVDKGACVSAPMYQVDVVRNEAKHKKPDIAEIGNFQCFVWEEGTAPEIRYTVLDKNTGTVYVSGGLLKGSGGHPRVVAFGNEFVMFYDSGASLFYRRVAIASPITLGSEVTLLTTLQSGNDWDARTVGDHVFVAWARNPSGTRTITLGSIDTNYVFTETSTAGPTTAGPFQQVQIFDDASANIWVLFSTSGNVYATIWNYAMSAFAAVQLIEAVDGDLVTGVFVNGAAKIFYTDYNVVTASKSLTKKSSVTYSGNIGSGAWSVTNEGVLARSVALATRAFTYADTAYAICLHDSTEQATYFLIDYNGNIVSKTIPGIGGSVVWPDSGFSSVTASYTFAHENKTFIAATENNASKIYTAYGVASSTIGFSTTNRFDAVRFNNSLHIAGGILRQYDGVNLVEHGFLLYPEGVTGTLVVGGGSLSAGQYQYMVTYEWTDRNGQIHRSSPSNVVTITTGANDRVTITVPTLRLTAKTNVRVFAYRTKVNEIVFYRIPATPIDGPVMNDKTVDTISFTDSAADNTIDDNEQIYTTGGVVSAISPVSCGAVTSHKGRVWLGNLPDGKALQFSIDAATAEAMYFNDTFLILPDDAGGNMTALESMDDKLIVFKRDSIYAVVGDGPSRLGRNSDYGAPQLITTDVGCRQSASVVATPVGLMFQSSKGIYILDRGLAVSYVGAPVEQYNSLTITSAEVVPSTNQVRFTTSGGPTLVYDYFFNQWSVFTSSGAVGATIWKDKYVVVRSDGTVLVENQEKYDDNGSFYPLKVTTHWLSLAGLQAYKRLYKILILGEYKGTHNLRVKVGFDFEQGYEYDQTIDISEAIATNTWGSDSSWGSGGIWGGLSNIYQFTIRPEIQKCQSIRLSISDSQTSQYNEGYSITGVTFDIGFKEGTFKTTQSRYRS